MDFAARVHAENEEAIAVLVHGDARAIVDQYIEGQKAVATSDMAMYMDTAGGDDNYAAMVEWASETLPKPEIEAINKQLDSIDRTAVTFAFTGLKAKYEAANGKQIVHPHGQLGRRLKCRRLQVRR